eukprot:364233-Chlamydomonas_euryale.AAC.14
MSQNSRSRGPGSSPLWTKMNVSGTSTAQIKCEQAAQGSKAGCVYECKASKATFFWPGGVLRGSVRLWREDRPGCDEGIGQALMRGSALMKGSARLPWGTRSIERDGHSLKHRKSDESLDLVIVCGGEGGFNGLELESVSCMLVQKQQGGAEAPRRCGSTKAVALVCCTREIANWPPGHTYPYRAPVRQTTPTP